MRTVFPTRELRDEAIEKYHAIEGGQQNPAQPGCLRRRDRWEGSGGLMAGKVFFSVSMSLDGFIAPEFPPRRVDGGNCGWSCRGWAFPLAVLPARNLKLGEGGEEGRDKRHRAGRRSSALARA